MPLSLPVNTGRLKSLHEICLHWVVGELTSTRLAPPPPPPSHCALFPPSPLSSAPLSLSRRLLQAADMWAAQEGQGGDGEESDEEEGGEEREEDKNEEEKGEEERKVRGRSDSNPTERQPGTISWRRSGSAAVPVSGSGSSSRGTDSAQQQSAGSNGSNGSSGAARPSFLSRWRGKK